MAVQIDVFIFSFSNLFFRTIVITRAYTKSQVQKHADVPTASACQLSADVVVVVVNCLEADGRVDRVDQGWTNYVVFMQLVNVLALLRQ